MRPEQEVRAAAIQAAAAFCAPIGGVADRQIPSPEDVLFVADVFAAYIESGWEAALRVVSTSEEQSAAESAGNVGPHRRTPEQTAASPKPHPQPVTPESSLPTPVQARQGGADVIPIEARGGVSGKQAKAAGVVRRIKRTRAEGILREFGAAKAEGHRNRLRKEAEESGLLDHPVTVGGREVKLGELLGGQNGAAGENISDTC